MTIDKFLMRGKDVFLLVTSVATLIIFISKYYTLPQEVDRQARVLLAQQIQIRELHDYTLRTDGRLANIELQGEYNKSGIDRIESWIKGLSHKS